jgi:hypothetical protein
MLASTRAGEPSVAVALVRLAAAWRRIRSREPVWSEPRFSEKGRTRRHGGAEKEQPSLVAARGVSMATGFSPSAATFSPDGGAGTAGRWVGLSLSWGCRRPPSQRRSSGSRASETATRCSSPPAPRSSQPRPNGDPAGVGRMPESLIIPFVLIGISVGKGAHCSVERVPSAEIGADRDRVA